MNKRIVSILSMFVVALAGACVPANNNTQPPGNVTTPEAQMKADGNDDDNGNKDRLVIELLEKKRNFVLFSAIEFSVKSAKVLHGKKFVSKGKLKKEERKGLNLDEHDYILETYSAKKKLLAEYLIHSSRFILWDDFENQTGGIDETNEAVIQLWFVHDKAEPISFLRLIDYKGKETEFLPVVITKEEKKE